MGEAAKLTIILAEDDPATSVLARISLEKLGLKVDLARDGAEAVSLWRAGKQKAALLDFNMPRMSGLDAARVIRQEEKDAGLARTRIILLTAKPLDHLEAQKTRGVVDFMISKPVSYADILSKLDDLLPGRASAEPVSQSAESASSAPPLNLDELAASVGRDGLEDILRIFITQADKYAAEMEEALSLGDGTRLSQIAHKLKGSSAQFTAHAVAGPAEFLQRNCAAGNLAGAAEKLGIIKAELERVKRYAREKTGA